MLFSGPEELANVILYAPAIFLAAWVSKRYALCLSAGAVLSFLTESWQAVSGSRAADVGDVMANICGVAIATAAAAIMHRLAPTLTGPVDHKASARQLP